MYILVRDFGYEGMTVHGLTVHEEVVNAWIRSDVLCQNKAIEVQPGHISTAPLAAIPRT